VTTAKSNKFICRFCPSISWHTQQFKLSFDVAVWSLLAEKKSKLLFSNSVSWKWAQSFFW